MRFNQTSISLGSIPVSGAAAHCYWRDLERAEEVVNVSVFSPGTPPTAFSSLRHFILLLGEVHRAGGALPVGAQVRRMNQDRTPSATCRCTSPGGAAWPAGSITRVRPLLAFQCAVYGDPVHDGRTLMILARQCCQSHLSQLNALSNALPLVLIVCRTLYCRCE